jgi:TetR/AcrR family transcriptional regulator, fatty acid biosynthesis regulator
MTATPAKKVRQRFAPERRRELILDHTADLLAEEGVAALSIEKIGRKAGISKSLVYAYFTNLTELLRALYQREMRSLRRRQAQAAGNAETFEELVRSITHAYLHYINERGLILQRLQAEPSVSELHDPTDFGRDAAVDYLAGIVVAHFNLPEEVARAATDISFGLSAAAGGYLYRHQIDVQTLEDITVSMVVGAVSNVKAEYMGRKQPLKRDPT